MMVRLSTLSTDRLYPAGNNLGTRFCWRLNRLQNHSEAGKIMSMKYSNYTLGNRTRDLPSCSSVNYGLLCFNTHFFLEYFRLSLDVSTAFFQPWTKWGPDDLSCCFDYNVFNLNVCVKIHYYWNSEASNQVKLFIKISNTQMVSLSC